MKQLLLILAIIAPLLGAGTAAADSLPNGYPKELNYPFHHIYRNGTIDDIDFAQHRVIIDDRVYRFDEETRVYSRSSQNDSQGRLRPGVRVGFRLNAPMPQGRYIQAFWLLPATFTPAEPGLE